jgi:hypothetical protein
MVVHGDAERARDLDDRPRHVDVGARGGGIAGGMVVDQTTVPATALISLDFYFINLQEGTATGGGKKCLFVIIP